MSQLNTPVWLDVNYFEKILCRNMKNTSVKVKTLNIEPCAETNDGFLSTLWRVHVKFCANSSDEFESFVVKMTTSNELAVEKVGVNGYDVQNKEMKFFEVIAPQMEKALKRIDDDENVFLKVIAVDREHDAIVFEDLKPRGFVMADKTMGLDEEQTKFALNKLAKFHAASLIIHEKHPKVFDAFDIGMFSRKVTAFNDAFLSIFELAVEEVATWPGYESYAEKMEKLQPKLIENATKCFDVKKGDFCVLNHGDMWKNNIMFKGGANNEFEDAILIDFQFCHWASPVLDLMHFLYTSLNDEMYTQSKIETFVKFFYFELKEILLKVDYDLARFPTLHEFQLEFLNKLFYGFVFTMNVFPVMISDDPDNDFAAHHSRDGRATNFKRRMLKTPKYQNIVKQMLPVYDQKGLLDV